MTRFDLEVSEIDLTPNDFAFSKAFSISSFAIPFPRYDSSTTKSSIQVLFSPSSFGKLTKVIIQIISSAVLVAMNTKVVVELMIFLNISIEIDRIVGSS